MFFDLFNSDVEWINITFVLQEHQDTFINVNHKKR